MRIRIGGWTASMQGPRQPSCSKTGTAASSCQHSYFSVKCTSPHCGCCLSPLPGFWSPVLAKNSARVSPVLGLALLLVLTSLPHASLFQSCPRLKVIPPAPSLRAKDRSPCAISLSLREGKRWAYLIQSTGSPPQPPLETTY